MALCFEALALTLVLSSAMWPSFTSPACRQSCRTWWNNPDKGPRWSLRKSEMVRKYGVLLAASTWKAMSSWSLWAMRREEATPDRGM